MANTFELSEFSDLKDLIIDKADPLNKRLEQYITNVKNPYMVRVGEILVKIEFVGEKSFLDALSAAILM